MEPIDHRRLTERGLSRHHLRTLEYTQPTNGVSLLRADAGDLLQRCRAIQVKLPPDGVFTHLTAARIREWWLPRLDDEPVIACSDTGAPHLDRRGVYVRRCGIPPEHRRVERRLRVASPEWTIVELAEHLSLVDLVVVIDCALHRGDTTVEAIRATMIKGRRGVRVLRRALDLADGRSESPWETVLRLLHVLCGIPVTPQFTVRDEVGAPLWALDLLIVGTRRAPEFDGGVHGQEHVRRRDLRRDKILARHGVERYGYCAPELIDTPEMIIGDAEDALGRPHDPARLKAWLPEVERSSFAPRGYGALIGRLRRFSRQTSPRARS